MQFLLQDVSEWRSRQKSSVGSQQFLFPTVPPDIGVITVQKVGGRSEARRAESGGGILGVSSPSGVRGRAPKKFGFWCILGLNFAVFHVLRGQNLGDE